MIEVSEDMEKYFLEIEEKVREAYAIAEEARKKGLDPESKVDIPLARNMAERVEGLISAVAPQVEGSGILERILELEKKYAKLDWRVALDIALEIAKEKFCKFENKKEAMEVAIRVGLAYLTLGVVASPLEGFTRLELKKRKDNGREYFCLFFSGPIRSAGVTTVCGSIVVADYIRKEMGYATYDPTEEEIKRMVTELYDYHEKVTNLQYLPSEKEIEFLVKNLPVQIDGDPSERYEVSNYKDLDRIKTNIIRNGPCLVLGEAVAQKAVKLWAQLSKWGKDFGLDNWNFIGKFLDLQKKTKAKGEVKEEKKIVPDYTFIKDLVAGRPVLTHPLRIGGFRLRYGRSRNSGLASISIHPATMVILDDYIGIGTQLRYERPGKSTAVQPCDYLEGPIVKLKNGDVVFLESEYEAKKVVKDIEEILFLGDFLVNYGEFFNRAHNLVPAGYCEEWYALELEKAIKEKKNKDFYEKNKELIERIIKDPIKTEIAVEEAIRLSENLKVPLHPRYTYHWKDINKEQFLSLVEYLKKGKVEDGKIILPLTYDVHREIAERDAKRVLELLGIPHKVVAKENIVIEKDWGRALLVSLGDLNNVKVKKENVLDIVNDNSTMKIKDKSGTFIGARMGRPEKAKMRKLTGSPQVLFPVGREGGRLRCFEAALEEGKVRAQFPIYFCENCKKNTIYYICEDCGSKCKKLYYCSKDNKYLSLDRCDEHGGVESFRTQDLDIKHYFKAALKKLDLKSYPELIKGVRGTSNKEHIPENLAKGILRASNDIYVNKDGTVRFDVTELPITHFKAKEIGVSVEKLKELGYSKDIEGNSLTNEEQLVEIKPQDVILPAYDQGLEEGADEILFRVANFVDEEFEKLYDLKKFYNLKSKEDLVGHLVIGLAPHTSAAIVGRIIGFAKTQGCYANPLWHSAMRRDCFSYSTNIPIYDGKSWQNVKIGEFVECLKPDKVVDSFGTLAKDINKYETLAYNIETKKIEVMPIKWFTKHTPTKLLSIKLENGRELKVTENHKFYIYNNRLIKSRAFNLKKGDKLIVPYSYSIPVYNIDFISLEDHFKNSDYVMIKNIRDYVKKKIDELGFEKFCRLFNVSKKGMYNYLRRNSFHIKLINKILKYSGDDWDDLPSSRELSVKRNFVEFPVKVKIDNGLMKIIGFYVAEGHVRKKKGKKGYYRVDFGIDEDSLREYVKKLIWRKFGLRPNKVGANKTLTYSSRLFYEFFLNILKIGRNAHTKRIPAKFLSLPKEKLSYLLSAYFEGDGSVSSGDLRVSCDTVSKGLIHDLEFVLSRFGIYVRKYETEREPGRKVREFYIRKSRKIPKFKSTKLTIPSDFCKEFYDKINFISDRKKGILRNLLKNIKYRGMRIEHDDSYAYLKIVDIVEAGEEITYCLNVPGHHNVIANGIIAKQCEGDETCVMLLMDALLNFSRQYLPAHRGATQDAPLVITSRLIAAEVDDMVFDLDVAWKYPLEFYEAAEQYKDPREISCIEQLKERLGKAEQYYNFGFTHNTEDINQGVRCSAYKSIPNMQDKVRGQMKIAEKIRAVDEVDVARLVIERHFIRDIKGNLRKFSMQEFRCSNCNEKYRRPPLIGRCIKCGGNVIFTVAEGGIVKYLEPSMELAEKYALPPYLKQSLELTKKRVESVFGKEEDKQEGLIKWFG